MSFFFFDPSEMCHLFPLVVRFITHGSEWNHFWWRPSARRQPSRGQVAPGGHARESASACTRRRRTRQKCRWETTLVCELEFYEAEAGDWFSYLTIPQRRELFVSLPRAAFKMEKLSVMQCLLLQLHDSEFLTWIIFPRARCWGTASLPLLITWANNTATFLTNDPAHSQLSTFTT